MTTYQFQCMRCFITSGTMSQSPRDAPTCCGGEQMDAIVVSPVEKCPACHDGLVRGGLCADTGQQEWVICPDCRGKP